tara:strand:- start:1587 stop:2600 length:1014 start_codon:yes stop_codon:yes gene_type:complete
LNFSSSDKSKNRINWIDQARGFAILMVVYGHNFPVLEKYIYTFHVPLFFCIAGFFHSKNNALINIKIRFKQLIIPYFIWSSLLYISWVFVTRFYGESANLLLSPLKNFIGIFYAQGGREYMDWGIPLWFLPCLFAVYTMFFFVHKIHSKNLRTVLFLLLIFTGFLIPNYFDFRFPWSFDVALVALCFYSFGYFLKNYLTTLNKRNAILLLVTTLLMHILLYFFNTKVDMYRSVYGSQLIFIIAGLSGSVFWLMFFKLSPIFNVFSYFGKNSIIILVTHLRVLAVIKLIIILFGGVMLFNFNEAQKIIITTSQLILMIPIIYFVNKYLWLFNGKPKKN